MLLLALARSACIAAQDPDMQTVYARALITFGWPLPDQVPATAAAAMQFASTLNSTCYWPDIDYFDQNRANWLTFFHLTRVTTMVQALTAPTSPVFENATLSTAVHCALGVWLARDFQNPNWWYQWIGVELNLQQQFLCLGMNRTTAAEQQQLVKYSFNSAWWVDDWGGGANLVWMIQIEIMRGLASNNVTAVSQGFSIMWSNVVVGSAADNWQGVQYDSSYHFHGEQIMSSAYGAVWLQDLLQFRSCAAGTRFDLPDSQIAVLAKFIAEGDAQLSFGGAWDWGTQGRGIDRPSDVYFAWNFDADAIVGLANATAAAPWRDALVAFAAAQRSAPTTAALVSNKYFWTSDFHVHHRATWGAALKMHGNNGFWTVVQNECDNGENLRAEHTGDGVLNVYASSDAGVANDTYGGIFPLLDWKGINGITVEYDVPLLPCGSGNTWPVVDTAFVGGVSDGQFGAAVMDSVTHNMTAGRAFFFFDAAIVALAARIRDPKPVTVRTALASRIVPSGAAGTLTLAFANGSVVSPVADGNYSFASAASVAWMHAGGLGIVPAATGDGDAGGAGVGLSIGTSVGDWSSIGPYPGVVYARMWNAWLDHGVMPANGSYAYVLLPNVTAADMPDAAAALGGVGCVVNSEKLQAASQPSASVAQLAVWSDAGVAYSCVSGGWALNVTVGSAALVTVREDAAAVNVTVAHPFRLNASVAVTVDRVAMGAGCAPAGGAGAGTVFTVPLPSNVSFAGASVTVSCAKSAPFAAPVAVLQ